MMAVSEAFSEDLELSKLKAARRINELVSEVIPLLIALHSIDFLSALQIDRYPITTTITTPSIQLDFPPLCIHSLTSCNRSRPPTLISV